MPNTDLVLVFPWYLPMGTKFFGYRLTSLVLCVNHPAEDGRGRMLRLCPQSTRPALARGAVSLRRLTEGHVTGV